MTTETTRTDAEDREPLDGMFIGNCGGRAHPRCYNREHPPNPAQNIYQVARGCGDPVLAAEVISQMVSDELAAAIVEQFNVRLMKQWRLRCSP